MPVHSTKYGTHTLTQARVSAVAVVVFSGLRVYPGAFQEAPPNHIHAFAAHYTYGTQATGHK